MKIKKEFKKMKKQKERNNNILMPTFLTNVDKKFKLLMKKKNITIPELLELKTFIIEEYENDTIIDIIDLDKLQTRIDIMVD